jgi:hypothetical protein
MAGEFGLDGTQALPPLPLYPDSLTMAASGFVEDLAETVPPPPIPPMAVAPHIVRTAAQQALARDRRRLASPTRPQSIAPAPPAPTGQPRNGAAGLVGCVVVLVFIAVVAVIVVVGMQQ